MSRASIGVFSTASTIAQALGSGVCFAFLSQGLKLVDPEAGQGTHEAKAAMRRAFTEASAAACALPPRAVLAACDTQGVERRTVRCDGGGSPH